MDEVLSIRSLIPDEYPTQAKELALQLDRLVAITKEDTSQQLRVSDPAQFARLTGGYGVWSFIDWLARQEGECPAWGSPARDKFLEDLWRDEPKLAGVMFTMVSRIAVNGWTISGPVDELRELWAIFAHAEESRSWGDYIKPVTQNYLGTDVGGVTELLRDENGQVKGLYYLPSTRCVPGPVNLEGTTWDLLYRDVDGSWKGLLSHQFRRMCSLPDTDPFMRRLGFCFMSRCQRAARLAVKIFEYEEEKLSNLPPEGIASVTGLTETQVKAAIALWNEERRRNDQLTFPGVLWLVANTFGQEAKVDFTSFRDVWVGFDQRNAAELYMKTVALDAGVDVGEFWQVEFHGATKAASALQHRKALGKGPAEFMVDFERFATDILPWGFTFRFDMVDDEQDLTVEKVREARIKNILAMWRPDPVAMTGLITTEQAQELLATERVVPQRFFMPEEGIVTDIVREMTGRDVGIIDHNGIVTRERPYWAVKKKEQICLPPSR